MNYDWSYDSVASSDSGSPEPSLEPPTRQSGPAPRGPFGPFTLRGELGRGGMGAVYRAWDPTAEREVALKVVLYAPDDRRRERFRREGELTARLNHPHILRVHSAGEAEGYLYLAYELVEGAQELEDAFATRGLQERVRLVRGGCEALAHAHSQGVVHRDVKPANALVDRNGQVKLADFGLAVAADLSRLTQTGALVGTPTHMAPEQFGSRGSDPGPSCDVWALGVLLYQALTRELPFGGATLLELGAEIPSKDPEPPRRLAPEVPEGLEAVCLAALRREPGERYPDAGALLADLDLALSGSAPSRASALRARQARRRGARRLLLVLAGTALVLAALLFRAAWRARIMMRRAEVAVATTDEELRALSERGESLRALEAPLAEARERLNGLPGDAVPRELLARLQLVSALAASAQDREPQGIDELSEAGARLVRAVQRLRQGEVPLLADLFEASELRFAELQVWRTWGRVRVGEVPGADELRAASAVLERLRVRADGALPEPEGRARVELLLARGEVVLAERALRELRAPSRRLDVEVRLAVAAEGLGRGQLGPALVALDPLELQLEEGGQQREQLLALALPLVERAAAHLGRNTLGRPLRDETDERALNQLLKALRLVTLLRAELPRPLAAKILSVVTLGRMNIDLALALSEAAPNDHEVQFELSRPASNVGSAEDARRILPCLERAIATAPGPAVRRQLQARRLLLLSELRADAEIIASSGAILEHLDDPALRARLLLARSSSYQRTGQPQLALADIDAAAKDLPVLESKQRLRRSELLRTLGREEEAHVAELAFLRTRQRAWRHRNAIIEHWRRGRTRYADAAEEALRHGLTVYPEDYDQLTRLAWLRWKAGQGEEALELLERALRSRVTQGDFATGSFDEGRLGNGPQRVAASRVRRALAEQRPEAAELWETLFRHMDGAGYRPPNPPGKE